jgi:hypothetical protein
MINIWQIDSFQKPVFMMSALVLHGHYIEARTCHKNVHDKIFTPVKGTNRSMVHIFNLCCKLFHWEDVGDCLQEGEYGVLHHSLCFWPCIWPYIFYMNSVFLKSRVKTKLKISYSGNSAILSVSPLGRSKIFSASGIQNGPSPLECTFLHVVQTIINVNSEVPAAAWKLVATFWFFWLVTSTCWTQMPPRLRGCRVWILETAMAMLHVTWHRTSTLCGNFRDDFSHWSPFALPLKLDVLQIYPENMPQIIWITK